MKYSKEVLEPVIAESLSILEVMRKLGTMRLTGGTHRHLSRQIKKFGIDTSHFLGQARNRGQEHKGGCEKLHWEKILVKNRFNGRKEYSSRLRRAMLESGIEEICDTCGLTPFWKDKSLTLQISHKDGNPLNNERYNLHFQCPNCHSQTEDFCGKGQLKSLAC
jgi:hypothetical protein